MADLSFVLLRVVQIEAHLADRHPQAASDPYLAALLRSLQGELSDRLIIAESESGE